MKLQEQKEIAQTLTLLTKTTFLMNDEILLIT